jgi:transposase
MIVIGTDTHKRAHWCAAVRAATGELIADREGLARRAGFAELLDWARALDAERVWAIEDCRHVSASFERWLLGRGERVVRVAPKLMAGARQAQRQRGKSDALDAVAVARAALREGVDALPAAFLDDRALDIKLLLDDHDHLVVARTQEQNQLRWHLHALWPELEIPLGQLDRAKWIDKVARRLARAEQTARVRVCRRLVRSIRQRTGEITALRRELADLVAAKAPALLAEPGCGPLTAAKLIAETAGAERFRTDAQFARICGVAPIPASSGRRDRYRLDRGGNRQLNLALHRMALNKARLDPATADYLARKQAEGKNRMAALRCLKRHLARRVWHLLLAPKPPPTTDSALT